jgi:hypothetical protein
VADKAGSSPSCRERFRAHLLAQLVCPGRHTLTSLITTGGRQFRDWTADYALYARQRVDPDVLFRQIRHEIESMNPPAQPLVVALDDTILRKTGKKIPGAAYRKDPLGPPFNVNLVWAQRMIQYSAAVPGPGGEARMIPIAFQDASTPRKPRKTAAEEEVAAYRETMRQRNLNTLAIRKLASLQEERTRPGERPPALHAVVDGSYTNRKILRKKTRETVVIGRIRRDAHLNAKPDNQNPHGRKRLYGKELPAPEEVRKDESIPWQEIEVTIGGKRHNLRVKTITPVRWRAAGEMDLRLVVIAPVPYLKRPGGKRLYRQPGYLICTDVDLPLGTLLQEYIWRWDIEVNHRDEKTILGVGQAQVRNANSVASVPAAAVAAYAMLHVAAMKAYGWNGKPGTIPEAKWRNPKKKKRASTQDLVNELRRELWSVSINPKHLTDFMNRNPLDSKSVKSETDLCSAILASTA